MALRWNETPSGTMNGSNLDFTLAATPATGSLLLILNGIQQLSGTDYTLSGATVTMTTAPESSDWLRAYYES